MSIAERSPAVTATSRTPLSERVPLITGALISAATLALFFGPDWSSLPAREAQAVLQRPCRVRCGRRIADTGGPRTFRGRDRAAEPL